MARKTSSNCVTFRRIFIECTLTYLAGGNTGIQRVVRNTINHCQAVGLEIGVLCQPVVWDEVLRRFRIIDHTELTSDTLAGTTGAKDCLVRFGKRVISRMPGPVRQLLLKSHVKRLIKQAAWLANAVIWSLWRGRQPHHEHIRIGNGDVLFLLDSTWELPLWPGVCQAKRRGARIGAMLYDLVPVLFPETCDEDLTRYFPRWLGNVLDHADFVICISQSVANQARDLFESKHPRMARGDVVFSYSHLGAELDLLSKGGPVRNELQAVFDVSASAVPYVCISTFEPRKNHDYLLDVFDLAWSQGLSARLVLVGKRGWRCQEFLKRIDRHPLRTKRLWVFHDLSDDEVAYCYRHARAMISSSRIEGFGLPAVEALSYGCQVWLSDIPVYREVGGDFCLYFDLGSTNSLLQMLLANDLPGGIHPPTPASEFSWPDWRTSTGHLLRRVLELSARTQRTKS